MNNNNNLNETANGFHINTNNTTITNNKETNKNSFNVNIEANKDENLKLKSVFNKLKIEEKNIFNKNIQDDLIIKIDDSNQSVIVNKLHNSKRNGFHRNNLIKLNKKIDLNQNISKDISHDDTKISGEKSTILNTTRYLKKFNTITNDKLKKKVEETNENKNNKEDENLNNLNTKTTPSSKLNENNKNENRIKGIPKLKINFSRATKKNVNDTNTNQVNSSRAFKITLTNNILKEENSSNKYVKYTRYHNKLNDNNKEEENNDIVYENEKNVTERNTVNYTNTSNSKIKKISQRIQGIRRRYINKALANKNNDNLNTNDEEVKDNTLKTEKQNNKRKIINVNDNNRNENNSISIFSIIHQTKNIDRKNNTDIDSGKEDTNVTLSRKAFYKSLAYKNKYENEQKEKEKEKGKNNRISNDSKISEKCSIKSYYCKIKDKNNKGNNLRKSSERSEKKSRGNPSTIVINNNININFGGSRNYIKNKSIATVETNIENNNGEKNNNNKLSKRYKPIGIKRTYTNSNVNNANNGGSNTSRIRVNKNVHGNNNKADNRNDDSVSNLLHKLPFHRKNLYNSRKVLKRELTNFGNK